MFNKNDLLPTQNCLTGRERPVSVSGKHAVTGRYYIAPFPGNCQTILLGMGCFWGAERVFWSLGGVYATAVGYAGGKTKNPSYEEVCSGYTNHTEVVLVVFEPEVISIDKILSIFWERHHPTSGMQQGGDKGTQYRSAIYTLGKNDGHDRHQKIDDLKEKYQRALRKNGLGLITTEINTVENFYYAEEYHQQYLHKNPNGYCGLSGCGVKLSKQDWLS